MTLSCRNYGQVTVLVRDEKGGSLGVSRNTDTAINWVYLRREGRATKINAFRHDYLELSMFSSAKYGGI